MRKTSGYFVVAISLTVLVLALPALSQQYLGSISAGQQPVAVATNPATNTVYVVNQCGNDPACLSPGTVTVIRGVSLQTDTVSVGLQPVAVAVNSSTNKIYVANSVCGSNYPNCPNPGSVSVIDGVTRQTRSVRVGIDPNAIVVNPATNKIYVENYCGTNPSCQSAGTITVIDGVTFQVTATVNVNLQPSAMAVNSVTNKIYVVNYCGTDPACQSPGTVTVIDGTTLTTTTVHVDALPGAVAINALTNQIYVANSCGDDPVNCGDGGTVSDIDATNGNRVTEIPVGNGPTVLAVDAVTNQIYVVNNTDSSVSQIDGGSNQVVNGFRIGTGHSSPKAISADSATNKIYVIDPITSTVTMIDGVTSTTTRLGLPPGSTPQALAVNTVTNLAFTANGGGVPGTASVVAGADAAALQFYALPPCRLVDTRQMGGGGPILGGTSQSFALPRLNDCIPAGVTPIAYSLNVSVVPHGGLGYLTIWPTGEDQPLVATLNSTDGRIKANAAIVPAGYQGAVSVFATNTTDVILDINGYFGMPGTGSQFYPLAPCRLIDTRNGHDQGTLHAGRERDYAIPGNCGIPATATAYSFNIAVVPARGGLDYLTVWPKGERQPNVSTLNDDTGTVVANAAIVPAGTERATAFYPHSNNTDLVVDVNGYFAAPSSSGLSMYPTAPCRVLDTRGIGDGEPFSGELTPPIDVLDSTCAPPAAAQAYIFNATVVPSGSLGYLTLWPDTEPMPEVSTLNAYDGFITSNMAIVPALDGSVDAYAAGLTELILDISGYFAP